MPSEGFVREALDRHDPACYLRSIPERPTAELPYDPASIPEGVPLMLDTTAYIDKAARRLPLSIDRLVAVRRVIHSAVALGELAISIGLLDPADPRTPGTVGTIHDILGGIPLGKAVSPSPAAHIEAGLVAGILARTQHLNRPRKGLTPEQDCCQKGLRRKLLNDALLFLSAAEQGACLVSANRTDLDRLLRFRPDAHVLLYQPLASPVPA